MNNNAGLNINDLNNVNQNNIELNASGLSENTGQTTTDEVQYEYLRDLNKKLTLFKKKNQFEKKEETEQTTRR